MRVRLLEQSRQRDRGAVNGESNERTSMCTVIGSRVAIQKGVWGSQRNRLAREHAA